MMLRSYKSRFAQRGVVLIASLLLLIVVTIIALSLFRSFGMQEKIAGNMREKQRALQAAESAQIFAEIWLSNGNASTQASVNCGGILNGNVGQVDVCANQLALIPGINVTSPPWTIAGQPVGVTYVPTTALAMTINNASVLSYSAANLANPSYFGKPTFYISDMGASADPTIPGEIYQVDAFAYGASSSTVAVVESTYAVYTSSSNRTL